MPPTNPTNLLRFFIYTLLLFCFHSASAQSNDNKGDTAHAFVMPSFPGGPSAYQAFLDKNLIYPPQAKAAQVEGDIVVQVLVFQDGSLSIVKIYQDVIGHGCAEEAKRLINHMPKWIPAMSTAGKPVAANYYMHIKFDLTKNRLDALSGPYVMEAPVEAPPPPREVYKGYRNDSTSIYETFDEQPEFPGGTAAYMKYLQDHIKYPPAALDAGVQGTIYISLVISSTGQIKEVKIQRDPVHYGCGDEAVRVIMAMPPWKPGKINGKAVAVRYVIPVKFVLPDKK